MNDIPPLTSPCGGPSLQQLRRLDTGELNELDTRRVRGHVELCAACQAVIQDFAADAAAVRVTLPFSALEARIPTSNLPRFVRRLVLGFLAPAAALGFVLFAFRPAPPLNDHGIRTKGGSDSKTALDFFVQAANGSRQGADGESLKAGDRIRLRYRTSELPYLLIIGLDADGQVFPYLADRDRSARVQPGQNLAPNAITLDADPRPERVFALYSTDPIVIDELKPVAKDAVASVGGHVEKLVELPMKGATQRSLLLNKAAR